MRIDRLEIQNFKKFASLAIDLHPHFNLLVGENGAGKTSILDALAVAAGVWLVHPPDGMVQNSKRHLLNSEIRLMAELTGDRIQFKQVLPASVTATGSLGGGEGVKWTRLNRSGSGTSDQKALDALSIILGIYERDLQGEKVLCPVLAYYGAGRAWLPSNKRWTVARPKNLSRRWSAFYDCFNERIRFADLNEWFLGETLAAVNRNGRMRPGFDVVKRAILRCVPEADNIWYDHDRKQLVVSISKNPQPLDNLSAGQGMMVALIADLAIKMITQNAYLLPPDELGAQDASWPRVLRETPGIVLIDELDVHLHPKWQRRVATDLKDTPRRPFPEHQLDYWNLLGACLGNEGQPKARQHCDTHQGNARLSRNPANPDHQIENFVKFLPDGSITSDDPTLENELGKKRPDGTFEEGVLNLNLPLLQKNRMEKLSAFTKGLSKRGELSRPTLLILRLISYWHGDTPGALEPYAPVIVYWLRKRLS